MRETTTRQVVFVTFYFQRHRLKMSIQEVVRGPEEDLIVIRLSKTVILIYKVGGEKKQRTTNDRKRISKSGTY